MNAAFHIPAVSGNQGTHHEGGLERFLLNYGAEVGCRSLNDAHAGSQGQGRVPIRHLMVAMGSGEAGGSLPHHAVLLPPTRQWLSCTAQHSIPYQM